MPVSPDPISGDEAFEHAPAGMAIVSLDGRLVRVNRALCELLGRAPAELLGVDVDEIVDPDGRPGPSVRATIRDQGRVTVERRLLAGDGAGVWAWVSAALVPGPDGRPRAVVAQINDLSERKRLEEDLRHAADHDALTGLLNRRRFELDLAHQVQLCRRYGESAAVLMLDLDNLKDVNDAEGHRAGDAALVAVARILTGRLRASDRLARIGGDELAAILPHVRQTAALGLAETLVAAIREEAPSRTTASVGVVVIGRGAPEPDDVLAAADRAMYAAKRGGRDRAALGRL
jgi:diguanylate cyclase (GGDEF)-like protein/PAS domain S-box-containing protein